MIRVLVVEDSPSARALLVRTLESDPRMTVVHAVASGEEALAYLGRRTADVVTMDIQLPGMSGFEATRRIMEITPLPVVIVSGLQDAGAVSMTFKAMEAGALAAVPKPAGLGHPQQAEATRVLLRAVRLMSEVKVVRRRPRLDRPLAKRIAVRQTPESPGRSSSVVAVGASTGGPPALRLLLSSLNADFPLPILIVQHVAGGFIEGMAKWLDESCPLPVQVAGRDTTPRAGHVYLAPDDLHMVLSGTGRIVLSDGDCRHGVRPSVSHLFRSVTDVCGRSAFGVLLTGMGKDGAAELKAMKAAGAVTMVQDSESAVVDGMPGEARSLGAATYVLPPEAMGDVLTAAIERRRGG